MADHHWKYESHDYDNNGHHNHNNDFDDSFFDSDPNGNNNNNNDNDFESPTHPKVSYHPYTVQKVVKKVHKHKMYDPGYHAAPKHHCPPVMCDPHYVVRDCYVPRTVPYIHPIVNINRHVIVNVPRHVFQPITRNVVVDPGCPCPPGYHPHHF